VPQEHPIQCWSCLGEYDALSAVWCACSARAPTKLCPFCFHCSCQADAGYQESFWNSAPEDLKEEREILKGASGSIGESLIRSNLLSTDQLVSALRWQQNRGGPIEDALVELGFVSRDNLNLVNQGAARGGATIDLSHHVIDASLVSALSVELCFRKKILPVSREEIGETPLLTLAMAGVADVDTIDQIQTLTDCRIIPMSAPEEEILQRLNDLFPAEVATLRSGGTVASAASPPPSGPTPTKAKPAPRRSTGSKGRRGRAATAAAALTSEDLEPIEEAKPSPVPTPLVETRSPPVETPAPQASPPAPGSTGAASLLQKILSEGISRHASTIQLETRGDGMTLFFRINGSLVRARAPACDPPAALSETIVRRASLPSGNGPASGRMSLKAGDRKIEIAVRRLPFQGGETLLLTLVEPSHFIRELDDLGMSSLDSDRALKALAMSNGLILLSGPPHNDREVTHYSLMAQAAREGRRILSLESPHLLTIKGVRHQEIAFPPDAAQARTALDAAHGAEIVFLPEIEEAGAAALAVEKASSCLVVTAVQARRASQVPAAVLWHQIEAASLAGVLKLVINQRLVRRICEGCRTSVEAAERVLKMMGLTPDEAMDLKSYQGSGCDRCGPLGQGYNGRMALFEILEVTPQMAALVAAGAPPGEIEREARHAGMSPLRASCLARVGQGLTTLEEFQKGNF
jgi:type II secretory ATPase GspE/PulE/Tfp pilus assembly ATPase PilB-like protein